MRHRWELRALEEMASAARRVQAAVFTPSVLNAMSEVARIARAAEEAVTSA